MYDIAWPLSEIQVVCENLLLIYCATVYANFNGNTICSLRSLAH